MARRKEEPISIETLNDFIANHFVLFARTNTKQMRLTLLSKFVIETKEENGVWTLQGVYPDAQIALDIYNELP